MVSNTNNNIRHIAFKLFLERGYEATSIRDICKEVGIEAASLYYHYASKQDLFFSIYDDICCENIKYLNEIIEIHQPISPDMKLYYLYKHFINHYSIDLGKQKFLLRYLFFPPAEISLLIQEKYSKWINEKDKTILDIISQCIDQKILHDSRLPNDYLQEYKRFENSQVIEMIISNTKMIDTEIEKLWVRFWNYTMLINV